MNDDEKKTSELVRSASRVVIIAGVMATVAIVGAGAFFGWRWFAYRQAVDRCLLGLSPSTTQFLDEIKQRRGEPGSSDCMREAGF